MMRLRYLCMRKTEIKSLTQTRILSIFYSMRVQEDWQNMERKAKAYYMSFTHPIMWQNLCGSLPIVMVLIRRVMYWSQVLVLEEFSDLHLNIQNVLALRDRKSTR